MLGAPGPGLAEFRGCIPRVLLDGPGWDRLTACAAQVPDLGSAMLIGCEFRLGEEMPAADLFLVVRPGSPLVRHYVRRGEAAAPGSAAAALGRYFVQFDQADSAVRRGVAGTMLEYDLVETPPQVRAEPGVFLRMPPAPEQRGPRAPQPLPIAALAAAAGWVDGEAERRSAARLQAGLPAAAWVAHVGALPSRAPRAMRLVIQGIEHEELAGVLERWGLRASIRPVTELLTLLREVLPRFRLAVDVTAAGLLPRLGLELYLAGTWNGMDDWLRTGRGDWQPVVERLARCGLARAAKAQGLLEWCALDQMYDRRGVFHVYKGINHVKLTVTDAGVGAKAYAGMIWSLAQDFDTSSAQG